MDARFLVAMLLAGCSSSGGAGEAPPAPAQPPHETTTAAPSFTWPVPDGWRSETIPFPLEFAPSIPHRGVEEIRFAPGFGRASGWDSDCSASRSRFINCSAGWFSSASTLRRGATFAGPVFIWHF